MNAQTETDRRPDFGFIIELATGTLIGAGLAMWLAPRAALELRDRLTDSAQRLDERTAEQYQQAGARMAEAVDDVAQRGQGVRNDVADAVARGAHEVKRVAT